MAQEQQTHDETTPPSGISRRDLLHNATAVTGIALGGLAVGAGSGYLAGTKHRPVVQASKPVEDVIRHSYSPAATHQPGVLAPQPAVTDLVAFDLGETTQLSDVIALLKSWSTAITDLMDGKSAGYLDHLAQGSVSLTITVGFGPRIFDFTELHGNAPAGFIELPDLDKDQLSQRWSGGDLLLVIAADDPTTVAYASRVLIQQAQAVASLRWVQHGSWRGTNADGDATTGRTLLGHMMGSGNPTTTKLDACVWPDTAGWFAGGTTLAVRRIQYEVSTWDKLTTAKKDLIIGRHATTGAPLTGNTEADSPDLAAHDSQGNLVIPKDAHIRLARNPGTTILRRGLNYTYEERIPGGVDQSTGLILLSYQANVEQQLVPILQSLDQGSALNPYATTIGSAVFVIPPGFSAGGYVGKSLIEG
ncbi:MAG: Dyp-type peroxidase [Propionibacteriaceae bacterium]